MSHYTTMMKQTVAANPSGRALAEPAGSAVDLDLVTHLPSRSVARQWIEDVLRRGEAATTGILLVGFDRLKLINTSMGPQAGDHLLTQMAERLQTTVLNGVGVSRRAMVARLCGDEFVVIVEQVAQVADLIALASRLAHDMARPFVLEGHEIQVRPSVGVVDNCSKYRAADQILRDVQTAMYRAKNASDAAARSRTGSVVIFDHAMHEEACRRMQLELALRLAVERQELSLAYQPIISFATGRVARFEALLRWSHPQLGHISPAEFIPVAEETGLILPMGEWVLRTACRQLARWRRDRFIDNSVTMSVNLSRVQMQQHDLPEMVRSAIDEADLCPGGGDLHLEITESAIMTDPARAIDLLNILRSQGVSISMDDFGTQYSSLSCLHQFPLNTIKIDRAFIRNLAERRDYAAVVHAIVTLAHNLDMQVTAEGIETPEQVVQLLAMECDFAQGFHFARPMPAEQAAHYLATYVPPKLLHDPIPQARVA
jgi:diguanylate cyclase (GGDEF)-like protein